MSESARLAGEIASAVSGPAWFGSSLAEALDGIDALTAVRRVDGITHSIWEQVLHATAWTRHVAYRLGGGAPGEPADGDWPEVGAMDEGAWTAAVAALRTETDHLVKALAAYPDSALDEVPGDGIDDLGGVTLYRLAAGVAQHDAYHAGQIMMLRKVLAD